MDIDGAMQNAQISIGKRLEQICDAFCVEAQIEPEEFVRRVGISQSTWRRWQSGKGVPDMIQAKVLSLITGKPLDDFYGDKLLGIMLRHVLARQPFKYPTAIRIYLEHCCPYHGETAER